MDVNRIKFIATVFISVGLLLSMPIRKAQAGEYRLRCESKDNGYNFCFVNTPGRVDKITIGRQLSDSSCMKGRTWDYGEKGIWVNRGCRADFIINTCDNPNTLRCESNDNKYNYCRVNTGGGVSLARQLSDSPCIQGRTWGYDRDGIWVNSGCRADFAVGVRNNYSTVRCESNDGKYNYGRVKTRGGVSLDRQLSDSPCIEGSTWGYDKNGIWVSGGCRAAFGVYTWKGRD
jgi:hypothetical protein